MFLFLFALGSLFCEPTVAQQRVDLPWVELRGDHSAGERFLAIRPDGVAALMGLERVELPGFPLSDGSQATLELQRIRLDKLELGLYVDGESAPGLLGGLDLSVWRGKVMGEDASDVALAFSQQGLNGWVRAHGALHHLMSSGGGSVRLVSEARLLALGAPSGFSCASDGLTDNAAQVRELESSAANTFQANFAGSPPLYGCPIAIETDYQLNQIFGGNLQAETAYIVSLLAWASYRFEEQIGTVLTYPYLQFYTTPNDPWYTQDAGGNCIDLVYEFQAAWLGNIPNGAQLAHFLSGANLGCGAAFIGGLCDLTRNFGVTGNMDGNNVFPIQVGPSNFNFYGVCHEIGHNFDAIHTHDYCPPIDECAPPGYFGPCQTQKVCTTQGTLMSYCHGCPGGFQNITTYFHPQSVADMRAWVESTCLGLQCADPTPYCVPLTSSQGCVPAIGWSGHPTLSGLDDFHLIADAIPGQTMGVLYWGLDRNPPTPFGGGTQLWSDSWLGTTLCVSRPQRELLMPSGGVSGTCTGSFDFDFSHAFMAGKGLLAGTHVYAQFFYLDPANQGASGVGHTDALEFVICP
ncbi:MAG TPA: M12 family metallo-peptidase [Planctomycetota bacterium]|nr:hypothetical protein [Planctomycetota bacterium]HPF13786.1 M12 family metallo-peptidase [Planctomycetota bacterium]HRV79909.1 M12 family metallo-peptidase [Planctomycetota bacterium]